MTRHVVSVSLKGDFLEIVTTAILAGDDGWRFELRAGDRAADMDTITALVASNAALSGVTDLTPFLS